MEHFNKLKTGLQGIGYGIFRYPLAIAFILAFAVINAITIEKNIPDAMPARLACIIGLLLAFAVSMFWERFLHKRIYRYILMAGAILLSAAYYLLLMNTNESSMVMIIRTSVLSFALFITAVWVPSIRQKLTFYESFLSFFKALFLTALFATVLFGGAALILGAVDALLFRIADTAFMHTANLVYVVFGITLFLSMTPDFMSISDREDYNRVRSANRDEEAEYTKRSTSCPKFLERLISYIIVPLTAIFTIILLIYILMNIRSGFWKDDLIEPMLVAYSITVIVVCVLTGTLKNRFASLFRLIFPKVLILLVALQMAASVMKIQDTGISHGRYYVLLYGLFAIITGVIFSFLDSRKHGIIAAVLIALSILSVIPPVDAFTVARVSQTNVLKNILVRNNMFSEDTIIADSSISDSDKDMIATAYEYLFSMGYTNDIPWLQEINSSRSFEDVFGFSQYGFYGDKVDETAYYSAYLDRAVDTSMAGYDVFAYITVSYTLPDKSDETLAEFVYQGKNYSLQLSADEEADQISLLDDALNVIAVFDLAQVKQRLESGEISMNNPQSDTTTFISDDGMKFLFTELTMNKSEDIEYLYLRGMWFYDFDN